MTTYSYDEAFTASLEYFQGNELAAKVFLDKYALRDAQQQLLERTPADMHRRLAREFARIETRKFAQPLDEETIFGYLDQFRYIVPQGSPMFGIGNHFHITSLSNCYVVPSPEDSYGGIFLADQQLAQISKRRGGVGLDVSHLRPSGAATQNAALTSTGALTFCERFSRTIREVGQHGRRGALMMTMDIHHPEAIAPASEEDYVSPRPVTIQGNPEKGEREIETDTRYYDPERLDFATMKLDRQRVTGANVSLRLSDEFLRAVDAGGTFEQRFPVDYRERGVPAQVSQMADARRAWEKIIHAAWQSAEPGILFWDNILRESPGDCYADQGFRTICTNPCSEIPLSAYDSCRLVAINLFGFVRDPFTPEATFDYEELAKVAGIAQRLMDDLVDLEVECIERILAKLDSDPEAPAILAVERELWQNILDACQNGRRTGTGITALGDTLAALGLGYGTRESIFIAERIYKTLKLGAYRSSVDMARELGPFPIWDAERETGCAFLQRLAEEDPELARDMQQYGRRNIALLTTAPTGSVSLLTETSSGMEPQIFIEGYTRRKKVNPNDTNARVDFIDSLGDAWQEYRVYAPKVRQWMAATGEENVRKSPWWGHTAEVLDWRQRVNLQSAIQRHCDHAISSTINLPAEATEAQVREIYETAWRSGCKGITVYRDGCRSGVLVRTKDTKSGKAEAEAAATAEAEATSRQGAIPKSIAPLRPEAVRCHVYHPAVMGHRYYVVVGLLEGEPYEVFTGSNHDAYGEIIIPKSVKRGQIRKAGHNQYVLEVAQEEGVAEAVYRLTGRHWRQDDNATALSRMISTALRHGAEIGFVVDQLEKTEGDLTSFAKILANALKIYIPDGTIVPGEAFEDCEMGGKCRIIRQEGCKVCLNCGKSKCG